MGNYQEVIIALAYGTWHNGESRFFDSSAEFDFGHTMNSNAHNPVDASATKAVEFHVFLSHNSRDKPAVEHLGLQLRQRSLKVWLDKWELRPGLSFQDALEDVIQNCKSAAICVAANGIGPWEDPEMKALLRRFINEKKKGNILPVIPVLLPGAPAEIELPDFLGEFTWVDLRGGLTQEGLDLLIWGITGERPPEFELRRDVDRELEEQEIQSPFSPGPYNWDGGDFPVTVLVSCKSEMDESRIRAFAEKLLNPIPVFSCSSNDILSAGHQEQFQFKFRYVKEEALVSEAEQFLKQSASRFLIVVADSFQGGESQNYARQIRTLFSRPSEYYCGLIGLSRGSSARVHDLDRVLDLTVLAESKFVRELTRTADGLRLKAPPAKSIIATEPVLIRLVQTKEEMRKCLHLRHLIYNRMHYLSDEIAGHPSELELDAYDLFDKEHGTGGIHFLAWSPTLGEVVGTARLIVPRVFEFSDASSVLGDPPEQILFRQAEFIRQIVAESDSDDVLYQAITRKIFNRMPVLQAANLQDISLLRGIGLAEISRVIVSPRYRGCGLGALLVRALVAAAIDLQKPNVVLECIPAHVPMYEKFGFRPIDGASGQDESLDQEAIAMILEQPGAYSRAHSVADNDLRMIRSDIPPNRSLADHGYLCLCTERGCWEAGHYELKDHPKKCPLKHLSSSIELNTSHKRAGVK